MKIVEALKLNKLVQNILAAVNLYYFLGIVLRIIDSFTFNIDNGFFRGFRKLNLIFPDKFFLISLPLVVILDLILFNRERSRLVSILFFVNFSITIIFLIVGLVFMLLDLNSKY